MVLPLSYYRHHDVLYLSRDLIGKFLITHIDGEYTGGMIVETEAYRAPEDRASHAYNGKCTPRNRVMFSEGGFCYVYRCYGIHDLFNIVTNETGIPHAILIRAIEPVLGIETMQRRRSKDKIDYRLTAGPGALTQALGIKLCHNAQSLAGPLIWIEDRHMPIAADQIIAKPRVGVDYAGEDALLPWRFYLKGSRWISKK